MPKLLGEQPSKVSLAGRRGLRRPLQDVAVCSMGFDAGVGPSGAGVPQASGPLPKGGKRRSARKGKLQGVTHGRHDVGQAASSAVRHKKDRQLDDQRVDWQKAGRLVLHADPGRIDDEDHAFAVGSRRHERVLDAGGYEDHLASIAGEGPALCEIDGDRTTQGNDELGPVVMVPWPGQAREVLMNDGQSLELPCHVESALHGRTIADSSAPAKVGRLEFGCNGRATICRVPTGPDPCHKKWMGVAPYLVAAAGLLAALAGTLTGQAAGTGQAGTGQPAAEACSEDTYTTRGVVKSFGPDRKYVNIAHEKIDGYMMAMTMSFEPRTPSQLAGLAPGDRVSFSFTATADGRRLLNFVKKD
jgi:Cu(I)/Ag(I) efflux system protein CusF